MDLVVDQGNTYCKMVLFDQDAIVNSFRVENSLIEQLENTLRPYKVDRGIISSVSSPDKILTLLKKLSINVHTLSHTSKLPIKITYATPETLGLDRIAAAVGTWYLSKNTTNLIIDIGTAITYDICHPTDGFVGGNITPGLDMRFKAMHAFTKRLPLLERGDTTHCFGQSTREAMINGAQIGITSEIEAHIAQAQNEYGEISVFLTGGDAYYFEKKIKNSIFVNSNLLMIGLLEILKIN